MSWLSSLASNIVGPVINYLGQNEINKQNIAASQAQQQQAQDYNTWLLGNQAQLKMQDMKAAGISPSFENGSLTSTPSPSIGSVATQQNPLSGFQDIGSAISSSILSLANARKANATAKLIETTLPDNVRDNKNRADISTYEAYMKEQDALIHSERLQVELNKLASDAQLSGEQASNLRIVNEWLPKQNKAQLDSLSAAIKETQQRTANLKHETEINKVGSEIAQKYGILPSDDGWKALMHLIASGKAGNVVSQILKALKDAGASAIDGVIDAIGL